ncbi:sensor protein CutS [Microtetraspora sp. NBRC 13810]|uniref:sensor histidine kinase n=1 Tax=Microtetraspora sp. NBRC 13810 TaxID=3030990 RepID=UPI0024A381C4|nr:HAMP domain-containing sensor histidine kinase [Microtetraspora sp. NBRC 13810]GLW07909.1 sensor protein CutS [Microtetraspora sp. NBRC 13810]
MTGRRTGRLRAGSAGRTGPRAPLGRMGLRARLTLLYSGLFFAAGSVLLWVTYLLTARAMEQQFVARFPAPESLLPPPGASGKPTILISRMSRQFVEQLESAKADVLADLLRNSALVMVAIGVFAILFGWVMTDRALRPLHRVTQTAERLSESTLHERIALSGPSDDVKRLADTFDAMLDRLQRAFDAQRRFVSNASHELRTPIAINRTLIEVALEEPDASDDLRSLGKALLGTNARHERLIEGLLLLARSENEIPDRRPVDLERVARAALEQLQPQARRRRVALRPALAPAVARGDALLLERCMVNLVENAVKYNVKDGHVDVRLSAGDDELTLTVSNTGPPISAFEIPDLFEPFRRLQDRIGSARGAGLGLSIVRAIVKAHEGSVEAAARPGGGLTITVRLPAARTALPESGVPALETV